MHPNRPRHRRRPAPDPRRSGRAWLTSAPGAGLGLQLDRYRYRIGIRTYGPAGAPLSLACGGARRERGAASRPSCRKSSQAGVGVDLDPVNLEDQAARAWLEACAPPEASALSRLAVRPSASARRHPARIIAGDVGIDVLPGVLGSIPAELRITSVADAYMAVFLPQEQACPAGRHTRGETGRTRPVTWLSLRIRAGPAGASCGPRYSVQGLALPPSLVRDYQHSGWSLRRAGSPYLPWNC